MVRNSGATYKSRNLNSDNDAFLHLGEDFSQFSNSAYGLKAHQRKASTKEKGKMGGKRHQKTPKNQRNNKYPERQLIIGMVLDNQESCV